MKVEVLNSFFLTEKDLLALRKDVDITIHNPVASREEFMRKTEGATGALYDPINLKLKRIDLINSGLEFIMTSTKGIHDVPKDTATFVAHAGGYATDSVAQYTLGAQLWSTNIVSRDVVRERGFFDADPDNRDHDVFMYNTLDEDSVVGIFGYGDIGKRVAERNLAWGVKEVLVFTRTPQEDERVVFTTKEEVLRRSNFLSVNLPLTPETRHIVGKDELDLMREDAMIINTGRGALFDIDALYDKLLLGKLRAVADVVSPEHNLHPILDLPNFVPTPHIASFSEKARQNLAKVAYETILAFANGEIPWNVVNKKAA